MLTNPPVVVEHLGRRFGRVVALQDVSFTVPAGTCLLLAGPNGAGKTTLLRILATSLRPTTGRARVCGWDVVREANQVREVCAYLGSSPGTYAALTGRENLHFAADMSGRPRRLADEWLERVGLGVVAHRPVASYSLGMRRRLALARVGLLQPAVLLADEPFLGLDEEGVGIVHELVHEVRRLGGGVILATHDWDRAQPLGDQVLVLRDGRPQPQTVPMEMTSGGVR